MTTVTSDVSPALHTELEIPVAVDSQQHHEDSGERGGGINYDSPMNLPAAAQTRRSKSVNARNSASSSSLSNKITVRRRRELPEVLDDSDRDHRFGALTLKLAQANSIVCTVMSIILIGLSAGIFILVVGIRAAKQESNRQFTISATNMVNSIQSSFRDYELASLWLHESCHRSQAERTNIPINQSVTSHLGICTRKDFQQTYEYIQSTGINTVSMHLLVNISDSDRAAVEEDGRNYYSDNEPDVNYQGIQEFLIPPINGSQARPSPVKPFYFAVHYTQPVSENKRFVDIDLYSSPTRRKAIDAASGEQATRPKALSMLAIRIPRLIARVSGSSGRSQKVYLFDSTNSSIPPTFLGASDVLVDQNGVNITSLPESELSTVPLSSSSLVFKSELLIAGKTWTVVVVSENYKSNLVFVVFGGVGIACASILAALGYYALARRAKKIKLVKAEADVANRLALWERQLNEHMAHEVRNPLASAIAALSFVAPRVNCPEPSEAQRREMISDVGTINASLQYIDQLLRNMLDHYRAGNKQMKLDLQPADIEKDIFEPVSAILFTRQANVQISIDCPKNLIVQTDRIRLKQICVNLSTNAAKFVVKGFIRLRAEVINSNVHLFVEDSGPGIPLEKRKCLFKRFQDSLDLLTQGTGIGLSVVKNLSDLLGIGVWLDEDYDSGIEGCPGTRFVICLNQHVIEINHFLHKDQTLTDPSGFDVESYGQTVEEDVPPSLSQLPEMLSVLYVDDDIILRKMFSRCIQRIMPNWNLHEAANGESALELVKSNHFDLIFMDQYMTSVEKQLLGTEAVRALRLNGVSSQICGLSANDLEDVFLEAGANAFMLKPFPCEPAALTNALLRILKKD